jgi:iron(III) transport system ATP-binding protein
MSGVAIAGLAKAFGAVTVLDGIDLHVSSGSLTVILGPSGCGKTTLLRLIAGFERPDRGTIAIDGQMVCDARLYLPPERRRIGYVAQEGALFPHLSVAENIGFSLPRRERRGSGRVAELLELVGLDAGFARRHPHELSGGQQQRVALARALASMPSLVLLDEPFSSLDAALRDDTRRAVAGALTASGATAILVTHDQGEALSLASQVAVMRAGRLVQVDTPIGLYSDPVDLGVANFLGESVVLPAVVRDGVAACDLGQLPVRGQVPDGPAEVLVRPEQIVPYPVTTANSIEARVLDLTYYGKDAIIRLELVSSGTTVSARVPGYVAPGVGERVGICVYGYVTAYPVGRVMAP